MNNVFHLTSVSTFSSRSPESIQSHVWLSHEARMRSFRIFVSTRFHAGTCNEHRIRERRDPDGHNGWPAARGCTVPQQPGRRARGEVDSIFATTPDHLSTRVERGLLT